MKYFIAITEVEERIGVVFAPKTPKRGDLVRNFTSREIGYLRSGNPQAYEAIEVSIISGEIPVPDAVGGYIVMIKRRPHILIGKAPKNIIDDLMHGRKKEGDEVEVEYEMVTSDSVVDTVSGKVKPFSPSPKINTDGSVNCK